MELQSAKFDRTAWQRQWRAKHPERARELSRQSALRCREQRNAYHRSRYQEKRQEILAARRVYFANLKEQTYQAYGGYICRCCGETTKAFLCVDHIHGNGYSHRKLIGRGNLIYKWLADNGFPEGFQILCFNCNQGRRLNHGVCPHVEAQYGIQIREI